MSDERTTAISTALDCARGGDAAGCLTWLLAAWTAGPALDLIHPIQQVDTFARSRTFPPDGDTPARYERAWQAAARSNDPVTRGVLIAMPWPDELETVRARCRLLLPHRDPRVSAKLLAVVESLPVEPAGVDVWLEMLAWLVDRIDPVIEQGYGGAIGQWNLELDDFPTAVVKRIRDQLSRNARVFRKYEAPRLSTEDRARCEEIVARFGASAVEPAEQRLRAEVYRTPDEDAPRSVYADWLQERGDPRGELIAMQLARRADTVPTYREIDLLAVHGASWLGSLTGKIRHWEIERGFVAVAAQTSAIDDDPAWSTLHTLRDGLPPLERRMPFLRSLTGLGDHHVIQLAYRSDPLFVEHLEWNGPNDAGQAGVRDAWHRIELPRLRWLTLRPRSSADPAPFEWIWSAPVASKLDGLSITINFFGLAAWLDAFDRTQLRRIQLDFAWRFDLSRGVDNRFSELVIRPPSWEIPEETELVVFEALANCAQRLRSVRVVVDDDTWDAPRISEAVTAALGVHVVPTFERA